MFFFLSLLVLCAGNNSGNVNFASNSRKVSISKGNDQDMKSTVL